MPMRGGGGGGRGGVGRVISRPSPERGVGPGRAQGGEHERDDRDEDREIFVFGGGYPRCPPGKRWSRSRQRCVRRRRRD